MQVRSGKARVGMIVALFAGLLAFVPAGVARAEPVLTLFPTGASGRDRGLVLGPDGNFWSAGPVLNSVPQVIRMTPAGAFTSFPTPGVAASTIDVGPDGNIWFAGESTPTQGTALGRITTSGVFDLFPTTHTFAIPRALTASSDGGLWLGVPGSFSRYNTSGVLTNTVVQPRPGGVDYIYDLTLGPDGNVWFAGSGQDRTTFQARGFVGRIGPDHSTQYPIPGSGYATGITVGPDDNLWFTSQADFGGFASSGGAIGRITPAGVMTMFTTSITQGSLPFKITAAADGNLWFTETNAAQIGRITPAGVVTEFPFRPTLPTNAFLGEIVAGPPVGSSPTVWFAEGENIGRVTLDAIQPTTTTVLPTTTTTTLPPTTTTTTTTLPPTTTTTTTALPPTTTSTTVCRRQGKTCTTTTVHTATTTTIGAGQNACANPTISGTAGNDTIVGTSGPDVIDGRGGGDSISGLGGNDRICGSEGDDRLDGGHGNDFLNGGLGIDHCIGGPGTDNATACESIASIP